MEKKSKNRLDEINMGIKNGSYPEKSNKISKKMEIKGFIIYLLIIIILGLTIYIGINYYGGMSFFDENLTHRSCDFLSIEGFPTLIRCSDGTYWNASSYNGEQTNSIEIMPVEMIVESTPPPFLCLTEDILRL
jgi:hypothetical protein